MSIYIKGMEMPTGCNDCFLLVRGSVNDICTLLKKAVNWNAEKGGFYASCPLIPVPEHGALIDRDDFFATCPELVNGYKHITDDLVVIPADKEVDE